jgi:hypothetical protein
MSSARQCGLVAIAACLFATALLGQITGSLRGVVIDTSGAAVPGANVVLTSVETGETREMRTDPLGNFAFHLLRIGNYEVKAEAAGFRAGVAQAEVRAGEIASLQLRLELGQITEVITVTDAVVALDTENAQVQRSITGAALQEIPTARNPNLFALTVPGVAPVSANNPFLGSGSYNSNGGRGRGNNITVDGITATDVSVTGTGGTLTPLNFSALKEVKFITNNFNAEYGRNASSQALYITKNGTNELHGELFEYLRNDKLNARPFFDRSGKASLIRQNEFGWAAGGPVYIPKVYDGRNKIFWFTDYEGYKQRGVGAAAIARVPTSAMVAQVTDPTSRALLEQYQLPTNEGRTIQTAAPNKSDSYKVAVRGDVNLGSKDVLWARYSRARSTTASSGLSFIQSNLLGFGATSENLPQQATLGQTHTFGPAAVNEFRFGFGRSTPAFPIDTPYPLGPRIQFANAEVDRFGVWEGLPQGRSQNTYQFTDTFSFIRGTHNFKAGGEYYFLQADSFFDALQRGIFTFANWDDFARGVVQTYQFRAGDSVRENRVKNFYSFFQDDWKVRRNLTLNLGVRMEWAGGPTEVNGRTSNLNLDNRSPIGAAGAGRFGILEQGKPSFQSNTNWAPRFGFSWSPGMSNKWVVRGGYGIAYDFVFLNPITNQRFLPPLIITGTLTGAANFTGENSYANMVAGNSRLHAETRAQVGQLSTTVLNYGTISPAIDEGLDNPQVQQWNFGIQREAFGLVFKAAYVGTKGNYLPRTQSINVIANPPAPATSLADETARLSQFTTAFGLSSGGATRYSNRIDPRYNEINYVNSSANSNYHSAQFEVQRYLTGGLMFNVAYTVGKSIDDNSDVLGVLINDSSSQQHPLNNRDNRGPSQFDLPQRLVITHHWVTPWGKGSSSRLVRLLLSQWGFAGVSSFRSGFPVTLDTGARRGVRALTMTGIVNGPVRPNASGAFDLQPRPAGSAGAPFGLNDDPISRISTYAASLGLSQPLLGNYGTLGRNRHRLNGETNFDLSVYKNFYVTEGRYFQIQAQFINAFNNTSFQTMDLTINSPTFGQYLTTVNNGRFIQLGARFVF